jgi:hypothetical protein
MWLSSPLRMVGIDTELLEALRAEEPGKPDQELSKISASIRRGLQIHPSETNPAMGEGRSVRAELAGVRDGAHDAGCAAGEFSGERRAVVKEAGVCAAPLRRLGERTS